MVPGQETRLTMMLDLLIWLLAVAMLTFLTRERGKLPPGDEHPAVVRSQQAYRRGSAADA